MKGPRAPRRADHFRGRAQATSYCETLAVLPEFCGCWPAYTPPAVPLGLNADPGADMEWPGWLPSDSQSWPGCPVLEGPRCVPVLLVVDAFDVGAVVDIDECEPGPVADMPRDAGALAAIAPEDRHKAAARARIGFGFMRCSFLDKRPRGGRSGGNTLRPAEIPGGDAPDGANEKRGLAGRPQPWVPSLDGASHTSSRISRACAAPPAP